jgi:hypothetical protein
VVDRAAGLLVERGQHGGHRTGRGHREAVLLPDDQRRPQRLVDLGPKQPARLVVCLASDERLDVTGG